MRAMVWAGVVGMGVAHAAPMELTQQGRLLDVQGAPFQGPADLEFQLVDGGDNVRFTQSFSQVPLANGYYAVVLGSGGQTLDSSVFLDHGAMTLRALVDSQVVGQQALGGYPVLLASQSLLATEASVQALASAGTGAYSETCDDFATAGWPTRDACLNDGRWHLIWSNEAPAESWVPFGSLTELQAYVHDGYDVRVSGHQASLECEMAQNQGNQVRCLSPYALGIHGVATSSTTSTSHVQIVPEGGQVNSYVSAQQGTVATQTSWWIRR